MEKRMVQNLLYKELSYQIHGAAIEVRKDFGPGHKEKLCQNAFAEELKRRKIPFEKEKAIKVYSPKDGKYIGLYRPDFIVDEKIIVEVKAEKFVKRDEFKRLYDYLRNSEYELAYFINFASPKLFVKRIIFTNDRKPFNPPKDTNTKLKNTKNSLVSISSKLVLFSGLLIGLILVLFGGVKAEAAKLDLTSEIQEIGVNQQFQVDLVLDTENEEINAVEGKITFPADLSELKEIRDGNSIISFWIERPKMTGGEDKIEFSGIIPGGYNGEQGLIFSTFFLAKKEGSGAVGFGEVKVLQNDGQGTEANTKISNFQFLISKQVSAPQITTPKIEDHDLPEEFTPQVAADPVIFEGKWFLVFATQDKGSGIDGYAVHESTRKKDITRIDTKKWIETESPYLLKDQKLRSYIYVKAVDKAENERIAIVEPRYPLKWYEQPLIWIIIILGVLILYIIGKILWTFKRVIH